MIFTWIYLEFNMISLWWSTCLRPLGHRGHRVHKKAQMAFFQTRLVASNIDSWRIRTFEFSTFHVFSYIFVFSTFRIFAFSRFLCAQRARAPTFRIFAFSRFRAALAFLTKQPSHKIRAHSIYISYTISQYFIYNMQNRCHGLLLLP